MTVTVEGVKENEEIISVQCADIVQPNDSSDVGIPCEATTSSNTVFEDENGNQITINDLSFKDRIKITLESRQNIDSNPESRKFGVERVVLLNG